MYTITMSMLTKIPVHMPILYLFSFETLISNDSLALPCTCDIDNVRYNSMAFGISIEITQYLNAKTHIVVYHAKYLIISAAIDTETTYSNF